MRILIVDDEVVALSSIRRLLKRRGFKNIEICDNGREAINLIKQNNFDLVLLDLLMPEIDGLSVLESTKPYKPETEFIILTAVEDTAAAVKAVRLGAHDYLIKTRDNDRLILAIERAFEHKGLLAGLAGVSTPKEEIKIPEAFSSIVTQSPRIVALLSYADVMARSFNPVLISGESGTGKELLARGIHATGSPPEAPFIPVNVPSIPESLFESQFFGYSRGAFTGAEKTHQGFFEQADGGTLFLDEIGELPPNLQAKLLRAIEEKSVQRLSEIDPIPISVRIISATNRNLDKACQDGEFRLDLLYRLKAVHVHLPPLRERKEDIPLLAAHFQKIASEKHGKPNTGFSREAMELLIANEYPGNIREMSAMVENAVLLADSSPILPEHLGMEYFSSPSIDPILRNLKEAGLDHVASVLKYTKGDRVRAAEILEISVRQVQRKVAEMKSHPLWNNLLDDI